MGIFELNLTMPEDFLLLAIIPSKFYVFGHIFSGSKLYRKPLPSPCSSQLELSGTPSAHLWVILVATEKRSIFNLNQPVAGSAQGDEDQLNSHEERLHWLGAD